MKATFFAGITLFALVSAAAEPSWQRLHARIGTNFVFQVQTNQLVTVRELRSLGGQPPERLNIVEASYPGFEGFGAVIHPGDRVLGPAVIESKLTTTSELWGEDVLLLLFTLETVNAGATNPASVAVQPASVAAAVALETSTDLRTWQPVAPGLIPAGGTNRFYRAALSF